MKELLIKSNCLIVEALEALDKTAMKCLLVVDDKNKLIGSLTDGDIRRAILKGINFNEPIDKAYFRSPKALTVNSYSKKEALKIMNETSLEFLPVVDKDNSVVDILNLKDISKSKTNSKEELDLSLIHI